MQRRFGAFSDELEAGAVVDFDVSEVSEGVLEGWATSDHPRRSVYIVGTVPKQSGTLFAIANRFNQAAFDKNINYGWCGFQFDMADKLDMLAGATVHFSCAKSASQILDYDVPKLIRKRPIETKSVLSAKQLVLKAGHQIDQIQPWQLDHIINHFIQKRGVREFIRRAYLYVLRRDADPEGAQNYIRLVEAGLAGSAVLAEFLGSEEYRNLPILSFELPGDANFPFYPE